MRWKLAVCLSGLHLDAFGPDADATSLAGVVCVKCSTESRTPKGPGRAGHSCGFIPVVLPDVLAVYELAEPEPTQFDYPRMRVAAAQEVWDTHGQDWRERGL